MFDGKLVDVDVMFVKIKCGVDLVKEVVCVCYEVVCIDCDVYSVRDIMFDVDLFFGYDF